MYGKRYVWIIIGWYEDKWWETKLNENHITCTTREMGKAVERIFGYRNLLFGSGMKINQNRLNPRFKIKLQITAMFYQVEENLTNKNYN